MNELLLVAGMALVTFAVRYPVLALFGKLPLPDPVFRALRYVPPAVLTAIIMPAVLLPDGEQISLGIGNAQLVAAVVAVIVAWRSKNLLLTIVIGMGVFWLWRFVIAA